MNKFEILARLTQLTEEWAWATNKLCGGVNHEALKISKKAYFDFCSMKDEIEKSLDAESQRLFNYYYPNGKPATDAAPVNGQQADQSSRP